MKWSPWPAVAATKKYLVKVKPLKLEGLDEIEWIKKEKVSKTEKITVIEMKWKEGAKSAGLVPFRGSLKRRRIFSSERYVRKGESVEWNDDFESVCSFSIDDSDDRRDVSFHILYGENAESKAKLAVIGKVSLNLGEFALKMEPRIERKLPITLRIADITIEASLLVSVSFVEIRSSQDSLAIVQNLTETTKEDGFLRWVTGHVSSVDKKKKLKNREEMSPGDSDESGTFASEGSPTTHNSKVELRVGTESGSSPSSEQLDSVQKVGFWKRKRLSFRPPRTKGEPLIKKTGHHNNKEVNIDCQLSSSSSVDSVISRSRQNAHATKASRPSYQDDNNLTNSWEVKELASRDEQAKLKAKVFFASFDQCSEKAAGGSACTALAAVIAHWLQSNPGIMPTRSEFDSLITEGSSEWRKLCNNKAYLNCFPNMHFDLETVLDADLRPLVVTPGKSFIGFFSPEKFESLKGTMSFDEIWNEINKSTQDYKPRIYIVGWNDHFFVLKVEADAYYIIDSLGERLVAGCNQAYILKFDKSALMYRKGEKEEINSNKIKITGQKEEMKQIICRGKECCREYIKRFLAAIPLRELEEEEKKGTASNFTPHHRLQIEFHYTSSPSSNSSATSSTCSLFSNEEYI